MLLLTKELQEILPGLGEQDGKGDDAVAYAKFFTPDSNWTWYVTEYDPTERLCFGLVDGITRELGYFSLNELESVKGPLGLPIERDLYFEPTRLGDLRRDVYCPSTRLGDLR